MSEESARLHLFEGYGIEIEYMIVGRDDLGIRPLCDELLKQVAGRYESEVEMGELAWSNELSLHLVELKTNGPASGLDRLADLFQRDVGRINDLLGSFGARLMPGAMHPWMDPIGEMRLWPHDHNPVYECFDRIFDCRGHGWANLQSVHLNLPFANDDEFARLHAAVRLLLPLVPALAASSPVMDARVTGDLDSRLGVYRSHVERVPSMMGDVIPEPVWSRDDYEREILGSIYRDLAPLDPAGLLRYEWANARGAIARFDRMALEIRLVDVQECPRADVAVAAALSAVAQALVAERWGDLAEQQSFGSKELDAVLRATSRSGDRARIDDLRYLECLGRRQAGTAGEVWRDLLAELWPAGSREARLFGEAIGVILERGVLARRIVAALGPAPDRARLHAVYARLCDCLAEGVSFLG